MIRKNNVSAAPLLSDAITIVVHDTDVGSGIIMSVSREKEYQAVGVRGNFLKENNMESPLGSVAAAIHFVIDPTGALTDDALVMTGGALIAEGLNTEIFRANVSSPPLPSDAYTFTVVFFDDADGPIVIVALEAVIHEGRPVNE